VKPLRLWAVLAGLYLSQGLPYGFFGQLVPVLLRTRGESLALVGAANLLALPWALKFAWAPLLDRLPRRRAILTLNLASVLALAALAAVGEVPLLPLAGAVVLVNLLAATQDIATDGLAVATLRPEHRGVGNGIQVGGYRLGMILGSGPLIALFDTSGAAEAFAALAVALAVATLPVGTVPEPAASPERAPFSAAMLHIWFARPGGWGWLALLAVYKAGDALGTGVLKGFLVDRGYSLTDIGWLAGVVGSTAGMAGALAGGVLVPLLGLRISLAAFAALQAGTLLVYAGTTVGVPVPVAVVCEHLCSGMATAALFTAMMGACRSDRPATDYTVQASVVVIFQGVGSALSGVSAQFLGYGAHFALAAALAALAVPVVLRRRGVAPLVLDARG
jgi:predicted MFS family arabinose efflux permease